MLTIVRTALALCCFVTVFGAERSDLPPLPSELPVSPPQTQTLPTIRRPRIALPTPSSISPGGVNPQPVRTYQPVTVGDDVLSWDSLSKEYTATPGELAANFSFSVTNVAKTNVVINWVRPSCGCTVAKLPPTPWTLAPGESGHIEFAVDLRNKFGVLSKYVNVESSGGQKLLNLKITIPNGPQVATGAPAELDARAKNMQLAMADRQTVFRGDCASCHAAPTVGKKGGEEIYAAACAICHDAPHRATMVPDLRASKKATGKDYWTHWITNGKPGSLMPSFAKAQGGPLDANQIAALAEFLNDKFPKADTATAVAGGGATTASLPATAPVLRN